MRTFFAAGIGLIFGLLALGATAQPGKMLSDRYPYLQSALVELQKNYYRPGPLGSKDAEVVARIACDALSKLRNDEGLRGDLQRLERVQSDFASRARRLLDDLTAFTSEFLRIELGILRNEGVPPPFVDDINSWLADARNRRPVVEISANRVMEQIGKLSDAVCAAQQQFTQLVREEEIRSLTTTIVYAVGGALVIVMDAGLATASGGVALASVSLGTIIASAAATKLSEKK